MPSLPTIPTSRPAIAIDLSHQRDEAIGREVDVPNTIARHAQNIREDQIDRLAVREQTLEALGRQGGEQAVCRGTAYW